MIQIDDWMIITGILAIFFLSVIFIIYIIITRKLFPNVLEFQKKTESNQTTTISTIEGSGIIKKIEIKTSENNKALIDVIVDETSFAIFSFNKKTSGQDGSFNSLEEILTVEINLDKKFRRNFSIVFHNRSENVAHSNGNIHYEIKKPLKITLKTLFSEVFH
jgi:hypothetical protein